MSEKRWIVVVDWERYQHRDSSRSKVPPWVKNETKLLSSPDYLGLTSHQRGVLHGVWLEYARSLRRLPDNTSSLSRQLGLRVMRRDIDALNHAGFITFSASRVASEPDSLDRDRDRESVLRNPQSNTKKPQAALDDLTEQRIRRAIDNGALPTRIDVDAELAASPSLTDHQRAFLRALVPEEAA